MKPAGFSYMEPLGKPHTKSAFRLSSFIQTVLSAPELRRICLAARGLYHRWGIAPRPEECYSVSSIIITHFN